MAHQSENTGNGKIVGACQAWNQAQPEEVHVAQRALMVQARRATSEDERSTITRRAQRTAASRSPSRRRSRATSPARSVASEHDVPYQCGGAWGHGSSSMSYPGCYPDSSGMAGVVNVMPAMAMPMTHDQFQPELMGGLQLPPVIPAVQASIVSTGEPAGLPFGGAQSGAQSSGRSL